MAHPCPECTREFETTGGLARHRTRSHDNEPLADRVEAAVAGAAGPFDDLPPANDNGNGAGAVPPAAPTLELAESEPVEETRPSAQGNGEKVKGMFSRLRGEKPKDGGTIAPSGETRPRKPAPRRVSTQAFWGDAVEGGAGLVARSGFVPMSRAMVWSSPVAGEIIEDATKGTLVDKGVQPIVRNAEKWSDLFDLIGFWGAIGLAQDQPEKAPMALMFARKRLVNLLPKIAKNIAVQRKKERQAAQALADVMPELRDDLIEIGIDPDGDPIEGMLKLLFAPPEGMTHPAEPQAEPVA